MLYILFYGDFGPIRRELSRRVGGMSSIDNGVAPSMHRSCDSHTQTIVGGLAVPRLAWSLKELERHV